MGKLIKFVLAVLALWVAWHVGISFYHFYVWEDAVQELVQLRGGEAEDVLAAQAAKLAVDNQVPLTVEGITVRKEAGQVVVEARYVDRVEVLPRYRYPINHTLSVKVYVLAGLPSNRK